MLPLAVVADSDGVYADVLADTVAQLTLPLTVDMLPCVEKFPLALISPTEYKSPFTSCVPLNGCPQIVCVSKPSFMVDMDWLA